MRDLYAYAVAECGIDHNVFWELSWFEWSLYARRHKIHLLELKAVDESHWARFRIQWADFRNANRGKKDKVTKPEDLIKLSFDGLVNDQVKTPDIEAIKKHFGPKVKKKNGK